MPDSLSPDMLPEDAPQNPMQEFKGLPWAPEVQPWADEAATRINAYDQQQKIADQNQAAGAAMVSSVDQFRQGLLSRTQRDPHFVHTALDLVQPTIATFLNAHPGLSDEDRQGHHDAIVGDINNQIARTAVQSMAEKSAPAAHDLMADPRIGGALTDDDRAGLTSYIGLQHVARNADAEALQQQQQAAAETASANAAVGHASRLYDPQTDAPAFQPQWAQKTIADNSIQPADKAALMHLYARLQTGGDAPASDPIMVQRALAGTMSHRDVLNEAGTSLRLPDALGLARAALPKSTDEAAHYGQVADTIQQARTALYGPNGENGAAGHAAWSRFVNWMLPTMRLGGADLQNPDIHPLNWLSRFQPTGDDLVPPAPAEGRRSLKEIFGR